MHVHAIAGLCGVRSWNRRGVGFAAESAAVTRVARRDVMALEVEKYEVVNLRRMDSETNMGGYIFHVELLRSSYRKIAG